MNTEAILHKLQTESLVLAYFSTPECNVCKSLLPKVKALLKHYPQVHFVYINTHEHPLLAGQYMVFAVPTLILFMEGREWKRFSRFIGLGELETALQQMVAFVETKFEK